MSDEVIHVETKVLRMPDPSTGIAELQREIYAINRAKGWHDEPLRELTGLETPTLQAQSAHDIEHRRVKGFQVRSKVYTARVLSKLGLIHAEIVEAEEEALNGRFGTYYKPSKPMKPEGYVVELADVVIRSLDTCEALALVCEPAPYNAPGSSLHGYVAAATEAARVEDYSEFAAALGGLLCACERVAKAKGADLWAVVRLKIDYNKTRSHRHGGKKA